MAMCCAFQSLPVSILEAYYGPSEDGKPYSNLGLNIIPPVLRDLSLGPSVRKCFSLGLEKSPDPDIRIASVPLQVQKKAEKSRINFQRPLLRSSEFHARFQEAIQHLQLSRPFYGSEPLPHPALNNFELLNQLEKDLEPISLPWVRPNGNFEALVGFILEDFLDAESRKLEQHKDIYSTPISGWWLEHDELSNPGCKLYAERFDRNDAGLPANPED